MTTPPPVTTSYLVCATPRSGSTLFCEALAATGVAGRPAEYFEAMYGTGLPRRPTDYFEGLREIPAASFLADHLPAEGGEARAALGASASYRHYLAWVLAAGTTPNGVFGAKLMWGHVGSLRLLPARPARVRRHAATEDAGERVPVAALRAGGPPGQAAPVGVAVEGAPDRDLARSARARGRDQRRGDARARFSFDAIDYLQRQITVQEVAWTTYFEDNLIEPLTIVYEDFLEAYESTLEATLELLGVPEADRSAPALDMSRQSDSTSDEWVERYQRGEYSRSR